MIAAAGAIVGLVLMPLTGGVLLDRPLVLSTTVMYAPSIAVALLARAYGGMEASVIPTLAMFLFMNGVVMLAIPLRRHPDYCCQQCGYDLRGASHERCPECGTSCFPVEPVDLVDPSE